VIVEGKKYAFHLLPSGILHERPVCLIGNGTVVHVPTLLKELTSLDEKGVNYKGRVKLSDRAHIVFDFHQQIDAFLEDAAKKVPSPPPIAPRLCHRTRADTRHRIRTRTTAHA
jgi:adenylosuccinate synthase